MPETLVTFGRRAGERVWASITIGRLAVALITIAVASIAAAVTTNYLGAWLPNIATSAITIALTIVVVDRVVERRETERARDRVELVLRRVWGDLFVLADFVLSDYVSEHEADYERPPADLRGLVAHWQAGLLMQAAPWAKEPSVIVATKALAAHLDEQLQRHDRVLEHDFVAAAHRFIRAERMGRNMYLDERHHHDDDGWRRTALQTLGDDVLHLLDAYEPYAARYLPEPRVILPEDAVRSYEDIRGI